MAIGPSVKPANVRLACEPGKSGNILTFAYTVENQGEGDVFVMDATPSIDPKTREGRADDQAAVIILAATGDAILGKFAAPPPTDRQMALGVVPLASRLAPGASLQRRLAVPLPLAESSPYFGDLPLRRYEMIDIKGIVFTIGYWQAGVDGLVAAPAVYAPDFVVVATRHTLKSAARVTIRFPTKGLQLFKRSDAFPRQLAPVA